MPTVENNGGVDPEEEDMDHFETEDRKSSEEESASGSGDGEDQEEDEDEGGSSEMDEDECDKRKVECMDDLTELSQQFCKLKDQLFHERAAQIEHKLAELEKGSDPDYLGRVTELEQNRTIRLQVAKILDGLRREAVQEKFKSEEMGAHQNMNSEKELLYDLLKADLEEKIKHLEEDRHNVDITSDLFESQNQKKRRKHDPFNSDPDRRKKPVQVSVIVYSLMDAEIVDDWTIIKRSTKQHLQRRKMDCL